MFDHFCHTIINLEYCERYLVCRKCQDGEIPILTIFNIYLYKNNCHI